MKIATIEPDPGAAAGGARPVAAVGDPPVPTEDDEPQDRHGGQADGQADERGADEAGDRVRDRVAGRHDERHQDPHDRRRAEEAEVGQPVTGLHDQRV